MPKYYISEIIGTGTDEDPYRPAFADTQPGFGACYQNPDSSGVVLVHREDDLDVGRDWSKLEDTDLEAIGVPVDDISSTDDAAQRVAQRFLARQILMQDDFNGLGVRLDQVSPGHHGRLRAKLVQQGVDVSGLSALMTGREAIQLILPRIRMRRFGSRNAPRSSGTFTDNFTDTDSTDLQDHTPSGGTGWTLVGGTNTVVINSNSASTVAGGTPSIMQNDDQGSANQYIQFDSGTGTTTSLVSLRATDGDNHIGIRPAGNRFECRKFVSGSESTIFADATTDINGHTLRLEAEDNSLEGFVDAVSIGSSPDSFNNTVTTAGIAPRQNKTSWIDNYENGVISGGAPAGPPSGTLSLMGVGI